MPTDSANYVDARGGATVSPPRIGTRGAHHRLPPPKIPSAISYILGAAGGALAIFIGLWWALQAGGDDAPLLPATLAASIVMLLALAAREVVMRRAWARYTRELEWQMGGDAMKLSPVTSTRPAPRRRGGVVSGAASLRALQQRLAKADEIGAQQPNAHLEAYHLCVQHLAHVEESIRLPGVATDIRAALRAGQERVRGLQRHHLLAWARGEAQRLTQEAQRRVSVSDKIETSLRAIEVISEALKVYPDERELRDSAIAVRNFIASIKVAHWVELAERAAFRGRNSRAVARYRDALFYLSRAEMGDDAREELAARINREIEVLRARALMGEGVEERGGKRADNEHWTAPVVE